jgi:hypothetical protein
MSKINFKKPIQDRYKGRGNTWVKVPFETKAYEYIKELFKSVADDVKKDFIAHNEREGFSWMRYKKVIGDENNPITIFEVRIKGSKIDQPEYDLQIPDQYVSELELLGNTPVKLQLESAIKTLNATKSVKTSKSKSAKQNEVFDESDTLEQEVKIIREAALTKPTDDELKEWYTFLKANSLYEESAWQ